MTSANQAPGTTRLPGIDVILPIGKPGAAADRSPPELVEFNGRSMLQWAVEEAAQAGANRILMIGAEHHPSTSEAIRQLRSEIMKYRPETEGQQIQIATLINRCGLDEGWDSLIRAAALHTQGPQVLLIDPAMALMSEGAVNTSSSLLLRCAAPDEEPVPLLATATTGWEDALCLPVFNDSAPQPTLATYPALTSELTVFAGRALLPLSLFKHGNVLSCKLGDFPFETFVRGLCASGVKLFHQSAAPVDCRFTEPRAVAEQQIPKSHTPFRRLGLPRLHLG